MGWDGMGWDGVGWGGMGWDPMGSDGIRWDPMGSDGTATKEKRTEQNKKQKPAQREETSGSCPEIRLGPPLATSADAPIRPERPALPPHLG